MTAGRFRDASLWLVAFCLWVGLAAFPVRADQITVTADMSTATVTEGGSLVVTYTVVATIFPGSPNATLSPSLTAVSGGPDFTDTVFDASTTSPETCLGKVFAAGTTSSCTDAFVWNTADIFPIPETGTDSGTAFVTATYTDSNGVTSNSATTKVLVSDAPTLVPEPSSLVMLGIGLLGMASRRKRIST